MVDDLEKQISAEKEKPKLLELPNDLPDLPVVQKHYTKMESLSGIRDINNKHRIKFENLRLSHVTSPLTQPPLASRCKTLNKYHRKNWYQRILLNSEKIDERIKQLNESIAETKKRFQDASANIITSLVAFGVILINGMLELDDGTSTSTIVTNLSGVFLNIVLAIKSLLEARRDRIEQDETLAVLFQEYKSEMWEMDQYINSASSKKHQKDRRNKRKERRRKRKERKKPLI